MVATIGFIFFNGNLTSIDFSFRLAAALIDLTEVSASKSAGQTGINLKLGHYSTPP
jgi:hypothetical protein